MGAVSVSTTGNYLRQPVMMVCPCTYIVVWVQNYLLPFNKLTSTSTSQPFECREEKFGSRTTYLKYSKLENNKLVFVICYLSVQSWNINPFV